MRNKSMFRAIKDQRKQMKNERIMGTQKQMDEVDGFFENHNIREEILKADSNGENNITVALPTIKYARVTLESALYGGSFFGKLLNKRVRIEELEDIRDWSRPGTSGYRISWNRKGEELNPPITY